jgi:23S rRNA (cytosine1962-C5)-methyltransferase
MDTSNTELKTAQLIVKPRKAAPFHGRHPWVLDSAIARIEGDPADGDIVELISDKGKWIARGIYNSQSRIRARLYTWNATDLLDDAFWRKRLTAAIEHRRQLGYADRNGAARLVYSEGDSLSGLIVDRYGDYLSIQVTALAVAARLDAIVALLVDMLQPKGIMIRTEKGVAQAEGITLRDGLYWGEAPAGPVFIEENGLKFGVDLGEGQKTGFYLDQRENRRVAASYLAGRKVLDMCCYSGGFSLTAAKLGGASSVLGIDTSAKAVALAEGNAALNEISNVRFQTGDVFDALDAFAGKQRFDAVVLDPPKFARSRQTADDALRAYHRLNRRGIDLLSPGGILVTCSCSGHVSREDFLYMLVGVAQKTGRDLQILEQRGASPDHPVSATCLETEYLKCFICRVE